MRAFLLDTNIWAYLFAPEKYSKQHSHIEKRLEELKEPARLGISVITWGEIAVGLVGNDLEGNSIQREHLKFIHSIKPWIIGISTNTAEEYGKLRGRLSENGLKRDVRLRKEELVDRFTWLELGSLENDLWIAAQAITQDLILVTNDRRSLEPLVEVAGNELHIENWAGGNT